VAADARLTSREVSQFRVRVACCVLSQLPSRHPNILKTFNDQFGNIPWTDSDRVHKLITEDIPQKVAADGAYQNAKKNSDKQNARIEHDKALAGVIVGLMKDDTELFKQFSDNPAFRRWLSDTVFSMTYETADLR
jgi:type I restriction enzyme, R subunit